MEKTTKSESTLNGKKANFDWKPIAIEMCVLFSKGVITGLSYKAGESLFKYTFTPKPKGDLKILDDYRKTTLSV